MGSCHVKSAFFVYCVIKRIVDHAPRRYFYARTRLRLWLPKARKINQFMLAGFFKSLILRTKVSFSNSEVIAL